MGLGSSQLQQVLSELETRLPGLDDRSAAAFQRWQLHCEASLKPHKSQMHAEIEAIATEVFPDLQSELILSERAGFYVVDMASESQRVAIEVDGPTHFIKGVERDGETSKIVPELTPKSKFQRAVLAHGGTYTVLSVPIHEWAGLKDDAAKRAYILGNKLAQYTSI